MAQSADDSDTDMPPLRHAAFEAAATPFRIAAIC
jgi:hypothetical protein